MGKRLIIKGADFSANAIDTTPPAEYELTPVNNALSITNSSGGYLLLYTTQAQRIALYYGSYKGVPFPANSTLTLSGLKGTNGNQQPLRVDYCIYNSDSVPTALSSEPSQKASNLLSTASNYQQANFFPLNTDGADSIQITNPYNTDVWIAFATKGVSNVNITASNYTPKVTFE